ncbi:MAG: DUF1207 domain-containing protein [Rhabdochlamydiaceae bacterium]|nr:DUF1207 domain-containing protein [Rhabdochlamydiaceae bacterium]
MDRKLQLAAWCSLFCFSFCADLVSDEAMDLEFERMAENYHVELIPAKLGKDQLAYIEEQILTRADSLPIENFEDATDPYLEGYIQALVDMHFYDYRVVVSVKDHHVTLSNLPKNELMANSIIEFVKDLPGVLTVEVKSEVSKEEMAAREKYVEQPRINGIWFPQSTVLFAPLIADPRQPIYSAAMRFGDRVVGQIAAAVSLGDEFPIYRWRNVFRWHGDLQVGIEGAVWSVFNYWHVPKCSKHESCELVNTDFYVGIPLTYAADKWSFRLRVYHISSHLGDEFLCNRPWFCKKRVNPSMEAIDFFSSYQFSRHLRGYFGPGVVVHSDPTFRIKPLYIEYGMELRILGRKLDYHRLYGTPFFAVHLENWQQRKWDLDMTFKLGYEISKMQGIGRKMRLYVDYHHGFSYEGQFFNERTEYGEVGFSWGF